MTIFFSKFLHFLSLTSKYDFILGANVQNRVSFDSLEHDKCGAAGRELIAHCSITAGTVG